VAACFSTSTTKLQLHWDVIPDICSMVEAKGPLRKEDSLEATVEQ